MIKLENIHLSFQEPLILSGSMEVKDHTITVLSGESGSGKSTLLYDIAFISQKADMVYYFNDRDVQKMSDKEKKELQRTSMSLVLQNIQLFECMTLMENIQFFSGLTQENFDERKARKYLTDLQLFLDDQTKVNEMSGGERQRLSIVCALMKETPLIIMDEPTAYLDEENKKRFLDILDVLKNDYHKTILIASHDDMVKDKADCLYEIKYKEINCIRGVEYGQDNQQHLVVSQHSLKNIDFFYHKYLKRNIDQMRIYQFILTLVIVFSALFLTNSIYSKITIDKMIMQGESQQIIVKSENTDNQEIKDFMLLDKNIKRIEPIILLESDNGYLICPYVDQNYFHSYIFSSQEINLKDIIFVNYETYRQNRSYKFELLFLNQKMEINAKYVLNEIYEDYRHISSQAKVIYVPFELFKELAQQYSQEPMETGYYILELKNHKEWINSIQLLHDSNNQVEIIGQNNILDFLDLKDRISFLSHQTIIFIYIFLVAVVFLMKINHSLQLRKNLSLLSIHGTSKTYLKKILYKIEGKQFIITFIVSEIILCFYVLVFIKDLKFMIFGGGTVMGELFMIAFIQTIIYYLLFLFFSDVKIIKNE